jgi:hypothetical protein
LLLVGLFGCTAVVLVKIVPVTVKGCNCDPEVVTVR